MGFSWAMFPRLLFLLLIIIFCSSGAEVVTVDVHAAKDQIKSGHKYLDVRYLKAFCFAFDPFLTQITEFYRCNELVLINK